MVTSSSPPKAIETVYDGYRFRSRLEARWAVFLRTLGVQYEYESEGYDLNDLWYLPDFYVADWRCFIEIKPAGCGPDAWAEAMDRALALANVTRCQVIGISGQPWYGAYGAAHCEPVYAIADATDDAATPTWQVTEDSPMEFAHDRRCDCIWVRRTDGMAATKLTSRCLRCTDHDREPTPDPSLCPRLLAAYTAARQARFEHGHSGD